MSRSKWKFNYIGSDFRNIQLLKEEDASIDFVLQKRATQITEDMVDFYLKVYNGMRYFSFVIENDKLGFLVGEFSPTKKRAFKKKKIAVKKKKSK